MADRPSNAMSAGPWSDRPSLSASVSLNLRSATSALRNIALLLPYDPEQAVVNLNMLADRFEEMWREQNSPRPVPDVYDAIAAAEEHERMVREAAAASERQEAIIAQLSGVNERYYRALSWIAEHDRDETELAKFEACLSVFHRSRHVEGDRCARCGSRWWDLAGNPPPEEGSYALGAVAAKALRETGR